MTLLVDLLTSTNHKFFSSGKLCFRPSHHHHHCTIFSSVVASLTKVANQLGQPVQVVVVGISVNQKVECRFGNVDDNDSLELVTGGQTEQAVSFLQDNKATHFVSFQFVRRVAVQVAVYLTRCGLISWILCPPFVFWLFIQLRRSLISHNSRATAFC